MREGLKLVKLANARSKDAMKLSFEGGVLEMHCAYALRTEGMHGDAVIRDALMAKL